MPLDNNKAERAIRKVVIRRKKTMGSKSPGVQVVLCKWIKKEEDFVKNFSLFFILEFSREGKNES